MYIIILKKYEYVFVFYIIPPHWIGTGNRKLSTWIWITYLSSMVNAKAADDLEMQGIGHQQTK